MSNFLLKQVLEPHEYTELKGLNVISAAIEMIEVLLEGNEEIIPTCVAMGKKGNIAFPIPLFNDAINPVIYEFVGASRDKIEENIGELEEFAFIAESHTPFEEEYLNETALKWREETGSFNGCPVPLQDLVTICFGTTEKIGLLSLEIVEFEGERLIVTKEMTNKRHPCRFCISSWEEGLVKGNQPDVIRKLFKGKNNEAVLET